MTYLRWFNIDVMICSYALQVKVGTDLDITLYSSLLELIASMRIPYGLVAIICTMG